MNSKKNTSYIGLPLWDGFPRNNSERPVDALAVKKKVTYWLVSCPTR